LGHLYCKTDQRKVKIVVLVWKLLKSHYQLNRNNMIWRWKISRIKRTMNLVWWKFFCVLQVDVWGAVTTRIPDFMCKNRAIGLISKVNLKNHKIKYIFILCLWSFSFYTTKSSFNVIPPFSWSTSTFSRKDPPLELYQKYCFDGLIKIGHKYNLT